MTNGSGDDINDGFISPTIFWPVMVSALIAGAIIGSIVTVIIGWVGWRCGVGASERVEFQPEADLNESKRYLRNKGTNLVKENSDIFTRAATKPKKTATLKVNSSSSIPTKTTTLPTTKKRLKPKAELKRINSTRESPGTTVGRMRRSISLGDSSLLKASTDQLVEELYTDGSTDEHYYACDVRPHDHNQPTVQSTENKGKSNVAELEQTGRHRHADDGPQYYNIGFKLKGGERALKDMKSNNSLPSGGVSMESHKKQMPQYMNVNTKPRALKIDNSDLYC